jgi:arginine:ornithine antiporter/lysine permease
MADNKLGFTALVAMCVGSMIGAGLFALPQNVAYTTSAGALLIAWVITFAGMICLVKVFQNLSMRYPNLDAGIYAYAKEGLGDYLGFCSAWGYWISAWIGNVAFVIMFCSALSLFFPIFGDGTNSYSLILNSILLWSVTFLCIKGVKSAALINIITTFAKVIPILIFIVIAGLAFNKDVFTQDIWQITSLGSVTDQIKAMMLVTVWTFIGIEGASVFSARARNRKDIGKATIFSFLIVFFILFAVSTIPFGILPQEQLAVLKNPSTGSLLSHIVGSWGNIFINLGLIISIFGALLAWTLMASEVPFIAGKKDGLFPKIFTSENDKASPIGSLIITGLCQQIYLIIAYFYNSGYLVTIMLATSMILLPYFFSAIFAFKAVVTGTTYFDEPKNNRYKDGFFSLLAIIYGVWLIYASGINYLVLSTILYLIGNIIFMINKYNRGEKIFKPYELVLCGICSIVGIGSIIQMLG